MTIVLLSFTTVYKCQQRVSFTGPIQKSDTDHQPYDDVQHPHMLLLCNGAIFLDLDQSAAVLPGPFHQSLLLPSFQEGAFPAKRVYEERESHSQESLP